MQFDKEEYAALVKARSPRSPLLKDMVMAFVFGGAICCVGQALLLGYRALGLEDEAAAGAVSVTLVLLGALLTALGVYDKLAKYAGAGTLVPITGYSNAVTAPALEFKSEGWVTGMAAKMFSIAGPVIVYGTLASVVYGLVLLLFGLA